MPDVDSFIASTTYTNAFKEGYAEVLGIAASLFTKFKLTKVTRRLREGLETPIRHLNVANLNVEYEVDLSTRSDAAAISSSAKALTTSSITAKVVAKLASANFPKAADIHVKTFSTDKPQVATINPNPIAQSHLTAGQQSAATGPVPSPQSTDNGSSIVFLIALIIASLVAVAILGGVAYCAWHVRARHKKLAQTGYVAPSPFINTQKTAAELRSTEIKARRALSARSLGKDAWSENFEQPPDLNDFFKDVSHKEATGERQKWDNREGIPNYEETSTDDSDHHSDHADKPARDPGFVKSPTQSRAPQTYNHANSDPIPTRRAADGARATRRSATQQTFMAAADKAFTEPASAEEKKRNRKMPHPKGTAVPPRPRSEDTDPPGPDASSAGNKKTKNPEARSSPPSAPPGVASSSGDQAPRTKSSRKAGSEKSEAQAGEVKAPVEHVVDSLVKQQIAQLDAEIDGNVSKDIEWKKRHFKELCLKWHPDKNTNGMGEAESSAQAHEVFKHLLSRRTSYIGA
jgi:hypothetical protein